MSKHTQGVMAAGCMALLTACAPQSEVDRLASKVDALEKRLVALESQDGATEMAAKVEELGRTIKWMEFAEEWRERAIFDIPSQGYSVAMTSHGPAALSFANIKPLGGGTRLTVEVVNMSGVGWSSTSYEVNYTLKVDGEQKSEKLEIESSKRIPSGGSIKVDFDLPGVKQETVSSVSIKLTPSGITYN